MTEEAPRTQMTAEYLSVDELLQLPIFNHLKGSTLAKWRQLGKGPKSVTIGGRPFYRKGAIEQWLREEVLRAIPEIRTSSLTKEFKAEAI
jgi:hypothetical protein